MSEFSFTIVVSTNVDYTEDHLKTFLSRILDSGKDYALYEEGAESDLADMMTEIIISEPKTQS